MDVEPLMDDVKERFKRISSVLNLEYKIDESS